MKGIIQQKILHLTFTTRKVNSLPQELFFVARLSHPFFNHSSSLLCDSIYNLDLTNCEDFNIHEKQQLRAIR